MIPPVISIPIISSAVGFLSTSLIYILRNRETDREISQHPVWMTLEDVQIVRGFDYSTVKEIITHLSRGGDVGAVRSDIVFTACDTTFAFNLRGNNTCCAWLAARRAAKRRERHLREVKDPPGTCRVITKSDKKVHHIDCMDDISDYLNAVPNYLV